LRRPRRWPRAWAVGTKCEPETEEAPPVEEAVEEAPAEPVAEIATTEEVAEDLASLDELAPTTVEPVAEETPPAMGDGRGDGGEDGGGGDGGGGDGGDDEDVDVEGGGGAPGFRIPQPLCIGIIVTVLGLLFTAIIFIILYTNEPRAASPPPSVPSLPPSVPLTPSERWNTLTPDEKWVRTRTDLIAALWKVVNNSDGTLGISQKLKDAMQGNCLLASDYEIAPRNAGQQCGEGTNNNFWTEEDVLANEPTTTPTWYTPDDGVQYGLAEFASTPIDGFKDLLIKSNLSLSNLSDADLDKTKGTWCAMPAPMPSKSNDFPVVDYWKKCVFADAGYFNLLQCNGGPNNAGTGNKAAAWLGVSAINPGVCYPAHQHAAAEAYWQIGGGTTWRTWSDNCTDNGDPREPGNETECTQTGDMHSINATWRTSEWGGGVESDVDKWRKNGNYAGRALPHNHPPWLVHEMDTSLTSGSGQPTLLLYFWGLSNEPALYDGIENDTANDYQTGIGQWSGMDTSNATEVLVIRQARGSCASPQYVPTPEQVLNGENVSCPR